MQTGDHTISHRTETKARGDITERPHIALFEPDIPQNVGTILRLGACLQIRVHIIEPCGFPFSQKAVKRSLMDYEHHVEMQNHPDWEHFNSWRINEGKKLILMTTKGSKPYIEHRFSADDILLFGSESSGVSEKVHNVAEEKLIIPMAKGLRSINVATAAAMIMGEALRQTGGFTGGFKL